MCGLVGVAGNLTNKEIREFTNLLMVNVTRGVHGTGVTALYDKKEKKKGGKETVQSWYEIDRSLDPSSKYTALARYRDFVTKKDVQYKILMGHSRHATVGDITLENQHPFIVDKIVGMHNGTITGKFEGSDKFDTDSEALYNLISKKGLEEALEQVNKSSTTMAFALAFYRSNNNSVNLIRNGARPLHYFVRAGDLFWASEKRFLVFALDMNTTEQNNIKTLPIGDLLEFFPHKPIGQRLKITEDVFKPSYSYTTYYSGNGNYFRGQQNYGSNHNHTHIHQKANQQRRQEGASKWLKETMGITSTEGGIVEAVKKPLALSLHPIYDSCELWDMPKYVAGNKIEWVTDKSGKHVFTLEEMNDIFNKGCYSCHEISTRLGDIHFIPNAAKIPKQSYLCDNCFAQSDLVYSLEPQDRIDLHWAHNRS